MRYFSFGGGIQSMAVLAMAASGKLFYDGFLFANVGEDSENPGTLLYYRDVAVPYAAQHGIPLVELRKTWKDGRQTTLYEHLMAENRTIAIPAFLPSGAPGNRVCTSDWKIRVIARHLKKAGATPEIPAIVGLGISMDEYQRMRTDSAISWQVLEYPLIDMRLTRMDCIRIISQAGLPIPPKSSCWFCPFQSRSSWIAMRASRPEMFDRACGLEKRLNEKRGAIGKDEVYLSSYLRPLQEAINDQRSLFEEQACESGFCMV